MLDINIEKMKQILSDEDLAKLIFDYAMSPSDIDFARAIEQAVMQKPLEQKPVAWVHSSGFVTKDADWVFDRKEECEPLYLHPAPSAPGTGSEIASKLKLLAMNWCNEHAQPVVCGSLNQKELYALIDQVCIGVDSPPSAPEGWQQFSHTLKYLIGTWRDGKGMFPQESDKYDESIAAAHLLLKEADWQQGRYFPILAAARSEL